MDCCTGLWLASLTAVQQPLDRPRNCPFFLLLRVYEWRASVCLCMDTHAQTHTSRVGGRVGGRPQGVWSFLPHASLVPPPPQTHTCLLCRLFLQCR